MKNLALTILASCLATGAAAQNMDEIAGLDVLPGWRTADGTHVAGLQITLAPGWKTYWRAPGDGGIPMQFDLAASENLTGAEFRWPVPEVFYQSGLRSVGYTDGVVIPMMLSPDNEGESIGVSGQITIGVCEEICIPMTFDISAVLPPQGKRDGTIVAALVDRPETADEAGVTAATCQFVPDEDGFEITTVVSLPGLRGNEEVVIETADPMVWVSEPDVDVSAGQITAVSDLVSMSDGGMALDRSGIRITILGEGRAIDVQGCTSG